MLNSCCRKKNDWSKCWESFPNNIFNSFYRENLSKDAEQEEKNPLPAAKTASKAAWSALQVCWHLVVMWWYCSTGWVLHFCNTVLFFLSLNFFYIFYVGGGLASIFWAGFCSTPLSRLTAIPLPPPSHRPQTFIITVTSGFLILTGFLLSLIKCWHFSSLIAINCAQPFLSSACQCVSPSVCLWFSVLSCVALGLWSSLTTLSFSTDVPLPHQTSHEVQIKPIECEGRYRGGGSNARNFGNYLFSIDCQWIIVAIVNRCDRPVSAVLLILQFQS